jgi:hypothetical protein
MSMPSDDANPALRSSSRLGRSLRDIGINVFANLIAAAIIWLGVQATGYVRGNAKITAVAVAILSAALGSVLLLVVESVRRSLQLKGRMPKLAASLPGIATWVALILVAIPIVFDLTPNVVAAWRSIHPVWRLLLLFAIFIMSISLNVIFDRRRSKRLGKTASSPDDYQKAPLLLRPWVPLWLFLIMFWIYTFVTEGIHLPWNY